MYVDGFNLYYGARGLCGRGTPGWRWLDLRGLAVDLAGRRTSWAGAGVERVVYCTARIDGAGTPSGHADQDVYLKALVAAGSVDHIEYGTYVARVKTAPLAVKDPQGRPRLVGPAWPVMIWWARLTAADLKSHQLPDPVGPYRRPAAAANRIVAW